MRNASHILVTGGAGFIGSNFIHYLFGREDFTGTVTSLDSLTYAGNLNNLSGIEKSHGGTRYFFHHGDICDPDLVKKIMTDRGIDTIVHFAAESHVDRSILGPSEFMQTNIMGTFNLLEAARGRIESEANLHFHHISTDEVYGSLGDEGSFTEATPYDPRSPYSASKASSDHLVRAYNHTYGISTTISNCSNNYGPYQFPEKLLPLMILNMRDEKPLPVYGEGRNTRDWLHVADHCDAVWTIIRKGTSGETYNIGGGNEWKNIDLVHLLCETMAEAEGRDRNYYKKLITFVKDRPGHDWRYAIDSSKIKSELAWEAAWDFKKGLAETVAWYLDNRHGCDDITSGDYRKWIEKQYQ